MLALLVAPSALVPTSRPAVSSRRVALGEASRFALGAAALAAGPLAANADIADIAAQANVRNPLPHACTARLPARHAQLTTCPAGQGGQGARGGPVRRARAGGVLTYPYLRPGIGSMVWLRTGAGSVGRSRSAAAIRPRARARGSQTAAASRGGLAACARLPQCCSVLPAILAPPCNPIPHPSQRASLARIPAAARDPHPRPCRGLVGLRREAEADPAGSRRWHRALDPLLLRKP